MESSQQISGWWNEGDLNSSNNTIVGSRLENFRNNYTSPCDAINSILKHKFYDLPSGII